LVSYERSPCRTTCSTFAARSAQGRCACSSWWCSYGACTPGKPSLPEPALLHRFLVIERPCMLPQTGVAAEDLPLPARTVTLA